MMKKILMTLAIIASLNTYADDFICSTNSSGAITLKSYTTTNSVVIVPYYVNVIGEKAFYNQEKIRTIFVPNAVTEIANEAFTGCEKLEHLRVSQNIEKFGRSIFDGCSKLDYVYVPNAQVAHNYTGYKWNCVHTEIKPWIDFTISTNDFMTIVYEGNLQESTDLKTWSDVKNFGDIYLLKIEEKKFFRSKK